MTRCSNNSNRQLSHLVSVVNVAQGNYKEENLPGDLTDNKEDSQRWKKHCKIWSDDER